MAKKYELTSETTLLRNGITVLYRIKAVRDFDDVKAGDLGGWVESEDNLSHDDNCWIYKDATVRGDAYVNKNAKIKDHALVYDDAWVTENAEIYGEAIIGGCACIRDFASVFGNTFIHGCAIVCEHAKVFGRARVGSQAYISGHSEIFGNAHVYGDTRISSFARVYDSAKVRDSAEIRGGSIVCGNKVVDGKSIICIDTTLQNTFDMFSVGPFKDDSNLTDGTAYITFTKSKHGGIDVHFEGTTEPMECFEKCAEDEYMEKKYSISILAALAKSRLS